MHTLCLSLGQLFCPLLAHMLNIASFGYHAFCLGFLMPSNCTDITRTRRPTSQVPHASNIPTLTTSIIFTLCPCLVPSWPRYARAMILAWVMDLVGDSMSVSLTYLGPSHPLYAHVLGPTPRVLIMLFAYFVSVSVLQRFTSRSRFVQVVPRSWVLPTAEFKFRIRLWTLAVVL